MGTKRLKRIMSLTVANEASGASGVFFSIRSRVEMFQLCP